MIPFLNLSAQYQSIEDEILQVVASTLSSTQFVLGPAVAAFEKSFAAMCGVSQAVAVNSGTSALHLALLAAGIGPGDEVITVPNTFVATVAAILYSGAKAVLVDIDPVSMNMDHRNLGAAITARTKAVVAVHLYGQPADMDPILALARQHGLVVIEDACQAHAATYKGKMVGSLGDMACFSFYPGKNLGAYGEGGMVVSDNQEYARKLSMLRNWGSERRYHHEFLGFNYRMDGIQGAILGVKQRYLGQWTESRRAIAKIYDQLLLGSSVQTPVESLGTRHVYHIYSVRSPRRDALQKFLQDNGIETAIHYPIPVHLQPGYAKLGYSKGDFPLAEDAARQVLSLPMCPFLQPEQAAKVAEYIHRFDEQWQ